MPHYIRMEDAARSLDTSLEELRDFEKRGWIATLEKDGVSFIRAHQRYRAQFIMDLRRKRHLRPEQITKVLQVQKPPFNLKEVDQILQGG